MSGELHPAAIKDELARTGARRVKRSAAEKIQATLRALSNPRADAEGMDLTVASMCMALERSLAGTLESYQDTTDVDDFVTAMTRFFATHRSDSGRRLVVVEMPRAPDGQRLNNGTRLHLLDEAEAIADQAPSPF